MNTASKKPARSLPLRFNAASIDLMGEGTSELDQAAMREHRSKRIWISAENGGICCS